MCGCKNHHDPDAPCTCICEEHGNFAVARKLAMERYEEIKALRAEIAEHERWVVEVNQASDRPTTAKIRFSGELIFDGVDRSALVGQPLKLDKIRHDYAEES